MDRSTYRPLTQALNPPVGGLTLALLCETLCAYLALSGPLAGSPRLAVFLGVARFFTFLLYETVVFGQIQRAKAVGRRHIQEDERVVWKTRAFSMAVGAFTWSLGFWITEDLVPLIYPLSVIAPPMVDIFFL